MFFCKVVSQSVYDVPFVQLSAANPHPNHEPWALSHESLTITKTMNSHSNYDAFIYYHLKVVLVSSRLPLVDCRFFAKVCVYVIWLGPHLHVS